MPHDKNLLFGVDIKAGNKLINLPVYEGDSDISLVERLYN